MSPTQRTLAYLRDLGWTAQIVEKWVPQARKRVDLFGWIDIIALDRLQNAIVGIQTTSGSNHSARREKGLAEPRMAQWKACGGKLEIISWSKKGKAGKRKVWTMRREEV